MTIIKSLSVGNGDMFYIRHNSDNFTIIDCNLTGDRDDEIIEEIAEQSKGKTISRFISTHPDQDHFGGIEKLDAKAPIYNFYVVKNNAVKSEETASFQHYCSLRDGSKASFIHKGFRRKWLNTGDDERGAAGISVLWPDLVDPFFQEALAECDAGESYNNVSAVLRYALKDGASVLWIGDLDTDFMENISDSIELEKTTVVFASHHGRKSGKIPDSWLVRLDPQIIVIGEAPSRHLHYYTGYSTITQNLAGDITMDLVDDKVHFYSSKPGYKNKKLEDEGQNKFSNYVGSITVETEYTLDG